MWRTLLVVFVVLFLLPSVVVADTSEDIVVTARGYIVDAPGNFTITYVSDSEVDLDWIKGPSVNNTMVRVKYGSYPEDRDDGYLVYYGTNNNCTDSSILLATYEVPYYKAWNQRNDGIWEEVGSEEEANFMSMSFLFTVLIILGLVLFVAAFRWRDILVSYAAALTWLAIGFWWIIGDITNFGLEDPWVQILVFIPFILAFAILLRLMNTEIIMEAKGKKWTEYGPTPKEEVPNRRTTYRDELRRRIGGRR